MADLIKIDPQQMEQLAGELQKLSGDLSELDGQIRKLEDQLRSDVSAIGRYGGDVLLTGAIGGQRAFAYQAGQLSQLASNAKQAASLADQSQARFRGTIGSLPTGLLGAITGTGAATIGAKALGLSAVAALPSGGLVNFQEQLQKKLKERMQQIWKKIAERITSVTGGVSGGAGSQTGGSSGGSSGGASAGTASSKNHDVKMVSAYSGDRNKDAWPKDYAGHSGCSVAASSSALSGLLGKEVQPKEIMAVNGGYKGDPKNVTMKDLKGKNAESMRWGEVAKANGVKVDNTSGLNSDKGGKSAQQRGTETLDAALKKYQQNPDKYAAPIIGCTFMKTDKSGKRVSSYHYVTVTGKNADGTYKIVDSSGNNAGKFTYSTDKSKQQLKSQKKGGYVAQIKQVVQYHT